MVAWTVGGIIGNLIIVAATFHILIAYEVVRQVKKFKKIFGDIDLGAMIKAGGIQDEEDEDSEEERPVRQNNRPR